MEGKGNEEGGEGVGRIVDGEKGEEAQDRGREGKMG